MNETDCRPIQNCLVCGFDQTVVGAIGRQSAASIWGTNNNQKRNEMGSFGRILVGQTANQRLLDQWVFLATTYSIHR